VSAGDDVSVPGGGLQPTDAPSGIYGPDGRAQFFNDPATDRFVASLLNLASEVWVQQERLIALEARDGASGSAPPDRDALLKQFIERVFAPLREAG
jgi:hypothetical protein